MFAQVWNRGSVYVGIIKYKVMPHNDKIEFSSQSLLVDASLAGQRLDAALSALFPDLGLRGRRRIWSWCQVRVDGVERKPGYIVLADQKITIAPAALTVHNGASEIAGRLRIIRTDADFVALYKPADLASAVVAGGNGISAEFLLKKDWSELWRKFSGEPAPVLPRLCNRLDAKTSGLLLAAFSAEALERFRVLERTGRVEKYYLALVHGIAPAELWVNKALDVSGRSVTKVLQTVAEDLNRHTGARRLAAFEADSIFAGSPAATLLRVLIKRGARHQIRAHLATAGFPIVGDEVYGDSAASACGKMYLHHEQIVLPGFCASVAPEWGIAAQLRSGPVWPEFASDFDFGSRHAP